MLEYPQVALDFMNRDHAEFVVLREKLLDRLAHHAADDEVDALLGELLEHTRRHFAEEERQMQEVRFPPYPMHKGEHDSVLSGMTGQIERWQRERDAAALRDWLDCAVGDWFVQHVRTMDFVTAGFIEMKRKTG